MKCVQKEKFLLHVLRNSKSKLFKAILKNSDDKLIQTLAEIVHNVLSGNVRIDDKLVKKLRKFKIPLRKIHSAIKKKRLVKQRRKIFINQIGGFWPVLLQAALQALGGQLLEYGQDAIKKITK